MNKTIIFIEKARRVHGNKYDYSKVEYINYKTKICIICPIHGEFWITPSAHLRGQGCKKCRGESLNKRFSMGQETFIKRAKEIHEDKYDYSKVVYVNNKTKVCIICPIHGEFWQTPGNHLSGYGCLLCAVEKANDARRLTTESFIEQAKLIHKDKDIDYSKVKYKDAHTKVCLVCSIHGEFWQTPSDHLRGSGCPLCGRKVAIEKTKNSEEDVLQRIKEIHGDSLIYDKFKYYGLHKNSIVTCPKHGDFEIPPVRLLKGNGCKKCANEALSRLKTLTTEEFKEKADTIHQGKYIYNKSEYINTKTLICIICPIHGEFWQTPNNHLMGCGCPKCSQSKLENSMLNFLKDNKMTFETQKVFDWLVFEKNMRLDFYLPEYNVAIECQGEQHFKPVDFNGKGDEFAEKEFLLNTERDTLKKQLCEEHEIKLLYYSNLGIDYPYKVYEDLDELLKEIKGEN